jgi:hypothetical protein
MSGPARKERLLLATQLPTPLYSIFATLQNGLDQIICNKNKNNDNTTKQQLQQIRLYAVIGVPDEENNHHPDSMTSSSEVVLEIPVPQVLTHDKYKKHPVKIHFGYVETPTPRVVAYADSAMMATDLYYQDGLLQELFPDDIGECVVVSSPDSQRENPKHMSFVWCNHLAGLYPVAEKHSSSTSPSSSSSSGWLSSRTPSAKIVLQQLQKRIRASATLNHILHALCRLQLPRIPQIETATTTPTITTTTTTTTTTTQPVSNSTTCKLISCTPIADHDSGNIVRYGLVLRKGTQSISATVKIHRVRYPAVPPVWELRTATPSTPSNTSQMHDLYNDRLAKLQHVINHESLMLATAASQQIESVHYYHEWILAHQLYRVVQYLEETTTTNASASSGTEAVAGRQYRGRNRQPIQT